MPLPVASAVIPVRAGGDILLQLRDNRPGLYGAGCWATLGGAVEPGETPVGAARRELLEEVGRAPGRLIPYGMVEGPRHSSHLFATRVDWPLDSLIVGEGQGVDWLAGDEVRSLPLAEGTATGILRFLDSRLHRSLAAGSVPPAPASVPLPPDLPRRLGLPAGGLLVVHGATAGFVRRLWDVIAGVRLTASAAADERANVLLCWPRGEAIDALLRHWRARITARGRIWVAGLPAPDDERLRVLARSLGFAVCGRLELVDGSVATGLMNAERDWSLQPCAGRAR